MKPIREKILVTLAQRYSPVLRFHERERFFPLLVESWLTTTSDGVWPEHDDREVRLRTAASDPSRRGAAVLTADRAMTSIDVLAGPPIDGTRPIDLAFDRNNGYSMASSLILKADTDAFLDVGGWRPRTRGPGKGVPELARGDIDHLAALCSELASAMNPGVPWNPPQDRATAPWSWVPQPPHPTMYCEITWAGAYPRTADLNGGLEFAPGDRSLDQMVAFTYHLFYGAREAPADTPGARHSEGQWEAITLFFRAELPTKETRPDLERTNLHLIRGGSIAEEPAFVVISQGQDRGVDGHWTELEDYQACELAGTHPIIYVAQGSHRNYFHPVGGETFDPNAHGPHGPDTTTRHNEDDSWAGLDELLAAAGIALGVAILLGVAIATIAALAGVLGVLALALIALLTTLAVLLVIAAIILFIMWIVSACDEASDKNAGEDVSPTPETDEAGPGGPQSGGDGSEDPAPPGPSSGGSSSGTSSGGTTGTGGGGGPVTGSVGLPNSGSPTGRETVFPDIRIVERLMESGAARKPTTFPTDQELENPSWWDYRGRWGVRVRNLPGSGTWESGWHRVDGKWRDWGYFAAERLVIVQNGGDRRSN